LRSRHGGFILTLELILIISILGIGLFVGYAALRDALFKYYISESSKDVYVSDANGTVLGKAIGFDEHEAPLVYYIDRSQAENYRVLIGVRDDRFTSREPVYYTELGCQGDPCLKTPSSEISDNTGVDGLPGTGAVSYLYAVQGGPTYAVGRSPGGIPGLLFRQGVEACPIELTTIGSRYISQKVELGEPCESPYTLPLPVTEAPRICPTDPLPPVVCPQVGPNPCLVGTAPDGSNTCSCPVGYYDAGVPTGVPGTCCPNGSTPETDLLGSLVCGPVGLVKGESVLDVNDPTKNVLETLIAPFRVNLPADADDWIYIPPDGESGTAELDTLYN
jgi:hypothetical protein